MTVADDGRGLPVDTDRKTGKNGIVKTLGTARAGGKFSEHTDATSTGAGLNGIGAAAAVFISARTDVTVSRDGKTYTQSFRRGYPGVFERHATSTRRRRVRPRRHPETAGRVQPSTARPRHRGAHLFDPKVAPDCSIDITEVLLRAHAAARMCPGVHLQVIDEGWPGEVPRCCPSPSTARGAPMRCWI